MARKPVLIQIETQGRVTLALLPYVAALPFLSDEVIAQTFGQTMAVLNWVREISEKMPMLRWSSLAEFQVLPRVPQTKEERRAQWRDYQRAYRKRKREAGER